MPIANAPAATRLSRILALAACTAMLAGRNSLSALNPFDTGEKYKM